MGASRSKSTKAATKDVSISIRMKDQDAITIDEVAQRVNLNKSELIRKAAKNFIRLHAVDNPLYPNPKLFFSHNLLKMLFAIADDETIKELARNSCINGRRDYAYIKKLTQEKLLMEIKASPEDHLRSTVENVLAPDGQNWFEKVHYQHKANKIIVTGRHDIGKNFSKFIKYLLAFYVEDTDYRLVLADMGETEVMDGENKKVTSFIRFEFKITKKK